MKKLTEMTTDELRAEWDAGFERAASGAGMLSFHERAAAAYRKVGRPDMAEQAEAMAAKARKT